MKICWTVIAVASLSKLVRLQAGQVGNLQPLPGGEAPLLAQVDHILSQLTPNLYGEKSEKICSRKPYQVRVADELMRSIWSQDVDWKGDLDPAQIKEFWVKKPTTKFYLPLL